MHFCQARLVEAQQKAQSSAADERAAREASAADAAQQARELEDACRRVEQLEAAARESGQRTAAAVAARMEAERLLQYAMRRDRTPSLLIPHASRRRWTAGVAVDVTATVAPPAAHAASWLMRALVGRVARLHSEEAEARAAAAEAASVASTDAVAHSESAARAKCAELEAAHKRALEQVVADAQAEQRMLQTQCEEMLATAHHALRASEEERAALHALHASRRRRDEEHEREGAAQMAARVVHDETLRAAEAKVAALTERCAHSEYARSPTDACACHPSHGPRLLMRLPPNRLPPSLRPLWSQCACPLAPLWCCCWRQAPR